MLRRDYDRDGQAEGFGGARAGVRAIPIEDLAASATPAERIAFIQKVYMLFFTTLGTAAVGVLMVLSSESAMRSVLKLGFWGMLIWFVGIFLVQAVAYVPVLNVAALWAWTFAGGVLLAPVIGAYAQAFGPQIIIQALIITAACFTGCTMYVFVTKKDFAWMGGMLMAGIFGLIVVGIMSIFWPLGGTGGTIFAGVGALIFCGFILYDTSNIMKRFPLNAYVPAAIALYLDFVNLFLFILRLLGSRRR